jgi:lysophospholipase L1-like esterase
VEVVDACEDDHDVRLDDGQLLAEAAQHRARGQAGDATVEDDELLAGVPLFEQASHRRRVGLLGVEPEAEGGRLTDEQEPHRRWRDLGLVRAGARTQQPHARQTQRPFEAEQDDQGPPEHAPEQPRATPTKPPTLERRPHFSRRPVSVNRRRASTFGAPVVPDWPTSMSTASPLRPEGAERVKGGATRRWLWGSLVALVMLVLLESLARIGTTFADDTRDRDDEIGFDYSRTLGWVPRPGYAGDIVGAHRAFDGAGYLREDSAQLGAAAKLLVVADSTGFGVARRDAVSVEETYAEVLERALPGVAVINLSVPGYSSQQGLTLLERELPRLRPRVVVVSFNFNDRRLAGSPDGPERFEEMVRADRKRRLRSHLLGWLRRAVEAAVPRLAPGGPSRQVSIDDVTARVPPEAYRRNLTAMATAARRAGAQVVFVLLSDNPNNWEHLRRGYEALGRGRTDEARAELWQSLALESWHIPLARKVLGQASARAGRPDEVDAIKRVRTAESGFGDRLFYFDWEYQDIMRAVAAEQAAPLVDGAALINAEPSLYSDMCHFDSRGHARIAAALREVVAPLLGASP